MRKITIGMFGRIVLAILGGVVLGFRRGQALENARLLEFGRSRQIPPRKLSA